MPKIKMARKSTIVDMTAMCDVAFLLLTFFMLATKFKKNEPVMVKTPSSISQITVPDTSIMLITVDNRDRIFFSIDRKNVPTYNNNEARLALINGIDQYKGLGLTNNDKVEFQNGASVGQPFSRLKQYLSATVDQQHVMDAAPDAGIPVDTSADAPNNELAQWIRVARNSNPYLRICIKGDVNTKYPAIDKIISTLGGMKIFRFNFITDLEQVPPGTPAYILAQEAKTKK
ncbi:MAG: biopolymer transporter ExbD [Chitinophagaceae bacterium]